MSSRASAPLQPLAWALATVATIVLMLHGGAGAPGDGTASSAAIVANLSAQADRWDQAIVRKDSAAIEANMAEDFRHIDGAGNVETKSSFVADLVWPDQVIDPYRVEDFDVRVYGDVAPVSGATRLTGRYEGKPFASHYRYIDLYVRRNGAWRIVSIQISRIPAPAPAAAAP